MTDRPSSLWASLMGMLLAGLVALPILWLSGARRASDIEQQAALEFVRLEDDLRSEIARDRRRLEWAVDRLRPQLPPAGADASGFYDWAMTRALSLDLDVLELHRAGLLVSSAHWPEQAGLPHRSPAAGLRLEVLDAAGAGRAAIVVTTLPRGEDGAAVRVGSFIDEAWVDRVVGRRPASIGHSSGEIPPIHSSSGPPTTVGGMELRRLELAEPSEFYIELATPAVPPLWRGVESSFLAAALAVGALFGALTMRRLRSPVRRLIDAVEAVRAGRADYDFSGARDEAWQELAAAFSRLQRSLETQQRRRAAAERVAAWRDVARRVAHEVKNPLVPIRLTVENLKRARERDAVLFDRLFEEGSRTILEEVDSLHRLVNEFAEFARMPSMQRVSIEFRGWLTAQLERYGSDPGLHLHVVPGPPVGVRIDPEQFGRVLKNLLSNAIEAMRDRALRQLRIELSEARGMVELTVADSGPGFDDETLRRAFEPYFTTREQGTGLGLSIVEGIVVEHDGWIEIGNRPHGDGAWVRVAIPLDGDVD